MAHRLNGKSALLTAAAHGIGRETALLFAAEGAHVIATDVDTRALTTLTDVAPGIRLASLDVTVAR